MGKGTTKVKYGTALSLYNNHPEMNPGSVAGSDKPMIERQNRNGSTII
jgi:hypothetical protein